MAFLRAQGGEAAVLSALDRARAFHRAASAANAPGSHGPGVGPLAASASAQLGSGSAPHSAADELTALFARCAISLSSGAPLNHPPPQPLSSLPFPLPPRPIPSPPPPPPQRPPPPPPLSYRVHTIVLNDAGRLIAVYWMHTAPACRHALRATHSSPLFLRVLVPL